MPTQGTGTQNKSATANGGFDLLDLSAGGVSQGNGSHQNKPTNAGQGLAGDFDLMGGLGLGKTGEKQEQRKKSPNELFDFGL